MKTVLQLTPAAMSLLLYIGFIVYLGVVYIYQLYSGEYYNISIQLMSHVFFLCIVLFYINFMYLLRLFVEDINK